MASSIALKRLVSSNLLPTSLLRRSFAVAQPASSRLFNTNALRECDGDDRDVDVDRRVYSPLSEVEFMRKIEGILYPKRISSSLSQTQNVMDQSKESPVTSSSLRQTQNVMDQSMESPVTSSSLSQTQNVMDQSMESPVTSNIRRKEANDGLHLRMDMPGLGKEDVKVSVEQNTLVIKGEGGNKEGEDDFDGKKYTSRIDLPDRLYKPNEIKAEMKNGVLKVFVPRTDVFQVSVE